MNRLLKTALLLTVACGFFSQQTFAQNSSTHNPTWWAKYQYLAHNASSPGGGYNSSLTVGSNVDSFVILCAVIFPPTVGPRGVA